MTSLKLWGPTGEKSRCALGIQKWKESTHLSGYLGEIFNPEGVPDYVLLLPGYPTASFSSSLSPLHSSSFSSSTIYTTVFSVSDTRGGGQPLCCPPAPAVGRRAAKTVSNIRHSQLFFLFSTECRNIQPVVIPCRRCMKIQILWGSRPRDSSYFLLFPTRKEEYFPSLFSSRDKI